MIFSKKDIIKLLSISLIFACAVFVTNLFLNYYLDLISIADTIAPEAKQFYDAIVTTCISVSCISGGSMVSLAIVMLVFYIKNFIESHSKEIGTLKALGYSSFSISKRFWIFGLSVFIGAITGYILSFIIMSSFYSSQNDNEFFKIAFSWHYEIIVFVAVIPTIIFILISVLLAYLKLRLPALALIKGVDKKIKTKVIKKSGKETSFLTDVSRGVLKQRKSFIFFAIFGPFCFSANVQMSLAMNDYASGTMTAIMLIIGVLLAVLIVLLSLTSLIKGNEKPISLMIVNGYSFKECKRAILDIYRPFGYLGFALGTLYQFFLMTIMVNVVFKDMDVLQYSFRWIPFFITLGIFALLYELTMFYFGKSIEKTNIKAIMLED